MSHALPEEAVPMPLKPDQTPEGMMGLVVVSPERDEATPDASGTVLPPLPASRPECSVDWRTLDPATLQGDDIPAEELRAYRDRIEGLLSDAAGQYVVIVGSEVVGVFPDFHQAVMDATGRYGARRRFLVKKIAAVEPIQTLGGVVG